MSSKKTAGAGPRAPRRIRDMTLKYAHTAMWLLGGKGLLDEFSELQDNTNVRVERAEEKSA